MTGFQDTLQPPPSGLDQAAGKSAHLSRRHLLTAMGSAATYLSLGTLGRADENNISSTAGPFQGCSPAPSPIPGGFNARMAFGPRFPNQFFHLFLPGPGAEPSTIFNFRGKVAVLNIHGTGTLTELDPDTGVPIGQTPNLPFATDVRFMQGTYIGVDGAEHHGTFAFF